MILIRECRGFQELQACVDLQVEVWGYCEGDVIPRRVFLVAQKIGGQAIGAFEVQGSEIRAQGSEDEGHGPGTRDEGIAGERSQVADGDQGDAGSLVGFAFSIPGVKTGEKSSSGRPEPYLHSHMLAVKQGYRDQNIGARLKLAQREDALGRGIERIEWTFDPLEIKNAFLNIHKLGAVARSYAEDFYGASSSRLQGGLQTDRLVAEWWLDSRRVKDALAGVRGVADGEVVAEIQVPGAIYQWKAEEELRHRAEAVQAENRQRFKKAFAEGLAVIGFRRETDGTGVYQLGRFGVPAG